MIFLLFLFFTSVVHAAVGPFMYDGVNVERAGTLLISYSRGKPCIILGHDRNLDKYMPSSGSIDLAKDVDFYQTLQRETLEETGGGINHRIADLRKGKLPLIFSKTHKILLGVMNDNAQTTLQLNNYVTAAINDPTKSGCWKEIDHFKAFPIDNFFMIAEQVQSFYKAGGTRNQLVGKFPIFTKFRGHRPGGGIVIVVKDEDGIDRELDSYYFSAIVHDYDKLKAIVQQLQKPLPIITIPSNTITPPKITTTPSTSINPTTNPTVSTYKKTRIRKAKNQARKILLRAKIRAKKIKNKKQKIKILKTAQEKPKIIIKNAYSLK